MKKAMEDYRQLCLKSFSMNRSGEVIQKQDLLLPRQVTFDSNLGELQEMVNSPINHALINHSNVLSNTIYNVVVRTFKEGQAPPLYAGPAYHQPGLSSVVAPFAPSAVAGTEVTSPPSTVGVPNDKSTPMTSGGRVRLNTDHWHQLCQGLCSKRARFLLIGGDMVCLRSFWQIILDYLRHLI